MKKETTKEQYLKIPYKILYNKNLDSDNKILLAEIESLSKLPGGCYASESHFAEILDYNREAVNKRLNKLEGMGFIIVQRKYKGKRVDRKKYRLNYTNLYKDICQISDSNIVLMDQFDISPNENSQTAGTMDSSEDTSYIVPPVQIDSSPENTINTITNTDILKQELLQENVENSILSKNPVCQVMTQAQAARARICSLEESIIKAAKSGADILLNAKYLNEKKLWDFVEDRSEYEMVVPLWKELVYVQNALYGR